MQNPMPVLTLLLTVILAGCGNNSSSSNSNPPPQATSPPPPASSSLEVLHASPDAPAVNVLADGSAILTSVPYKGGSGFISVAAGQISLEVEAIIPGGNAVVIGPASLTIASGERISVIAVGATANIEPLVLTAPAADLAPGQARLRVVHGAPAAPQVDVYATAPDAALADSSPLGSFAFTENLGPLEVPADTYRIRVTPAGDPATVVYDSGPLVIEAGADLVITAVQNTGPGDSLISLVALDGSGAAEILDIDTPAALRVVHASPDAPNVDVVANDDFANRPVQDLAFPDFTDYLELPAVELNVKVVPTTLDAPVVIDADLTLVAGFEYSVLAVGLLADIEPLVLVDDNRRVATEARVRIVHASPAAGDVDIYVTAQGADIDTAEPAFAGVAFKDETGYVALAPGEYAVTVTGVGSKLAAIGPVSVDVAAGGIYTAIARDAFGGGLPVGLILLDDFTAP